MICSLAVIPLIRLPATVPPQLVSKVGICGAAKTPDVILLASRFGMRRSLNEPEPILLASNGGMFVGSNIPAIQLAAKYEISTIDCAKVPLVILLASKPGMFKAEITPTMLAALSGDEAVRYPPAPEIKPLTQSVAAVMGSKVEDVKSMLLHIDEKLSMPWRL